MHGGEILVPILICLSFFAMVFGIVYLYKKENLAMIEKGRRGRSSAGCIYKGVPGTGRFQGRFQI